jgi:diguanylate cyclase (GGDEF)-like protein
MEGRALQKSRGDLGESASLTGRPLRPGSVESAGAAGRVAAALLVMAGVVTIGSVGLPEPAGFNRAGVLAVGAIGVALGGLLITIPWQRWSNRASLAIVPPALTMIALHNWFGGEDPFRYSIFFVAVFVWVGTFHRRGTSVVVALPTTVAYLVPLLVAGAPAQALASAAYAVPLFVVVGEILAWRSAGVNQLESELREAALHDPLTGLANRRLVLDRLHAAVARAARSGEFVHVLYLDIDDFKAVNDTFGHDAGDAALVAVAAALTKAVRPSDTVARLGGDEFVVVVESPAPDSGQSTAARISRALQEGLQTNSPSLLPAMSIGIASDRGGSAEPLALLRAADAALYAVKHAHKDRTVYGAPRAGSYEHAIFGARTASVAAPVGPV